MREYIICIAFWMFFTILLHMLGRILTKGRQSEAYALITGYLFYSFWVAVGGLVTQLINLPWMLFAIYLISTWVILAGYILYKERKSPVGFFTVNTKEYIKQNWTIYVILAVLVGMLFFYYKGFWLGNHLDDGYYITKVATLPYTNTGYGTNYSVGVSKLGFDTYIVNTWELEASVYVKLLGVSPTLYLRLFQSTFYYFLFLNVVKAFSEKILNKLKFNVKDHMMQYPTIITLLFGGYYIFLAETNLLPLRDLFQFNTGMFLGTSIVKMLGILLLLFYYLDADKITGKMIIGTAFISLILLSKSTIALPIILVITCSYFATYLFFEYGKKEKIVAVLFLCIYTIIAVVLPGVDKTQELVYSDVLRALHSPVIIVCMLIFGGSFLLKEKIVNRINCIMILSVAFMLVPQVNDIFERCSVYSFVSGRACTTWLYSFVLLNSIYLFAVLVKLDVKEIVVKVGYVAVGVVLTVVCAFGFNYSGDTLMPNEPMRETNIKHSLKVILNNPYFIPNSTIFLGDKLEQLSKDIEEQLYVVSPEWVEADQTTHAMAVMLRTYAPDIISVSAAPRYPVNNGLPLEAYNQDIYTHFVMEPNEKNSVAFEKEINKAGVNCIVVQNENCSQWLEGMGYKLYSVTEDHFYYIWYRS